MFSLVPPAGTPTSIADILSLLGARLSFDDRAQELSERVKAISNTRHVHFINSGRAALSMILKSMALNDGPDKSEIVIPAYTCFTVAAAVASCNLKIKLVDIDPSTLDYDYSKLEEINFDNVLAIIGCNLFGIPCDWNKLKAIAKAKNIKLIDDAAQAMGSTYNDKRLGSNGDVGFYSLGRGKNLSAYSGGIIVTDNEEINQGILTQMESIKDPGFFQETNIFVKIVLYSIFLNPPLYRLAASIPFLGIGKTVFDMNFHQAKLSRIQICLALRLIPKLAEYNSVRQNYADMLVNAIAKSDNLTVIGRGFTEKVNYLRLPILYENRAIRDITIERLNRAGISASAMYPSTIRNIPGIEAHLADQSRSFAGAEQVVDRLLTLPTHPNLRAQDIQNIIFLLDSNKLK
jgi:perosamine synthetase